MCCFDFVVQIISGFAVSKFSRALFSPNRRQTHTSKLLSRGGRKTAKAEPERMRLSPKPVASLNEEDSHMTTSYEISMPFSFSVTKQQKVQRKTLPNF